MAGQQRISSVDVDAADFLAGLKRAVAGLKLETTADLHRLGLRAVRNMQQLCPVDTGRLRASIGMTAGQDARGPYIDVGTNVDYALPVEYGTSHMDAQPFARPGLAEAVRAGLR